MLQIPSVNNSGSVHARPHGWRDALRRAAQRFVLPLRRISWPRGARAWALWVGGGFAGTVALCAVAFYLALAIYKPVLALDRDLYALNRPAAFTFKDARGRASGAAAPSPASA